MSVTREELLRAVFSRPNSQPGAYMDYYNRQTYEAQHASHGEVLDAITKLINEPDSELNDDDLLAAQILTMHSGVNEKESVRAHITRCHPQSVEEENVRLERYFDVRSLERIGGFEIMWTDDLSEHLRIRDNKTGQSVRIFHHAAYLNAARRELFPDGFLEETLRTLALLFPHRSPVIRKWFDQQVAKEEHELDRTVLECGRLSDEERRIDEFVYWRDRLVVLKQAYDEAEPQSIKQWWQDRRKKVQWATFWVALLVLVLTVFFGLVQSVEGALQVWLAWKAMDAQGTSS